MSNKLAPGNSAAVGMGVIDHSLRTVRYGLAQSTTFRLLAQNDVLHTPYKFCTAPEYITNLQAIVDREPDRVDDGYEQARLFLRQLASNQLPERYYAPPSDSSSEEEVENFAVRPVSPALAETESSSDEEEREEWVFWHESDKNDLMA
ncbi:unnamed protein product [Allacma fusca]|uniref:Uncharacterized protein n=1 Tax=Allacma fusca TaxID=39272 RepID=A0A8J2KWW4_9HEXA|nr:unnamed protein product [Allacma fusca]